MVDAPPTVGELVTAGTAELNEAGLPDSRREAMRLWADLSRTTVASIALDAGVRATDSDARRFLDAISRRTAGEPIAYLTGWTGFRRLLLRCDRRALIPRPETEGLVEAALHRARTGRAADIGTGTGAIALALKDEGDFDEVIGTDVSGDALALAAENGVATGRPVTWMLGDLLAPLAGRQLDLVVSNPPYLTVAEYDTLDRSVRDYEPALALVGGTDGQLVLNRLLTGAQEVLAASGWLALEVDCRRADDTARRAVAEGWWNVTVLDDLFGRARYVLAQQGSRR